MACEQSPNGKHQLVKWYCDDPLCCTPGSKNYAEKCRHCGEPMGNARRKWKREQTDDDRDAEPCQNGDQCSDGQIACWSPGGPCPVPDDPECDLCGQCADPIHGSELPTDNDRNLPAGSE